MYCPAGKAIALVHARSTSDVQHVMRVASEHRVPVVPQGARSGLSGAATIDGCILLSLEKMNEVLEIDVANRLVVTQPGIFNADLSKQVAEKGLFEPPTVELGFCRSGATSPPTPAACAASSTASRPTTCSASRSCWPTAR